MILVRTDGADGDAEGTDSEHLRALRRFNESLSSAGILLAAEALTPGADGLRVRVQDGRRTVHDSSAASEYAGVIAAFWLWQVSSLEEAVEWVRRMPAPPGGMGAEVEIRPVLAPGRVRSERPAVPPSDR